MESLKELRGVRELTQEALAERAGVSRSQIIRIEQGECSPSMRTLFKLSEALRVSPAVLLER